MSKLPKGSTLDQAIDGSARMYNSTAEDYATYLRGEYESNYEDATGSWLAHFENTRSEFNGLIMDLLDRGVHFSDMNIAVVGPGLKPVGRELGNTACRKILPKANSLVVADFSPQVVQESVDQIKSKVNMKTTPVLPMIIDLTDGLSTAYRRMITESLNHVNDEQALCDIADELGNMDTDTLDQKLNDTLVDIDVDIIESLEAAHSIFPPVFQGGGLNVGKNRYALSVNGGQELPLHALYLPMVIAGTGAAAEHMIWETYDRVTSDPDRGAKKECDETIADREQMIRQFYNLIARYNTLTASKSIEQILHDNPQASILAVSDVSTVLYQYDIGVVPRLNVNDLRAELTQAGVSMKQGGLDWEWHDEPEHYHGVNAFTFRKLLQGNSDDQSQSTEQQSEHSAGEQGAKKEGRPHVNTDYQRAQNSN